MSIVLSNAETIWASIQELRAGRIYSSRYMLGPIDPAKGTRMHYGHAQYLPMAPSLFALLAAALGILLILVQIRVLRYAYMQLGVSSGAAFVLLFASLLGSYVNIPIGALGEEPMVTEREVTYFGMRYVVPTLVDSPEVILAVNVGGAVIPTLLSIYLLSKNGIWGRGLIATAIVAAICHALAQPIRGVGIGLPIFVAPLAAAVVAAVVAWRYAAPLAYAGGSLGVLIGADLLNLDKLQGLGAPVLSIGGAGTFDGIFVTGMMAVLLAGFTGGGGRHDERVETSRPRRRAW
jgi:uncharacterized membrane protein